MRKTILSVLLAFISLTSLATIADNDCIADLTGATMNGTKISQRYIMIGLHENSMSTSTTDAQRIVLNNIYYILGKTVPTSLNTIKTRAEAPSNAITCYTY